MEAVHCRAQVSVSRGPPLGFGCHPCPRRISRSPRRGRLTAPLRGSHTPRTRSRHMCAQGAASPAAQIPPSAELRHLVVCRIRSGPVPAGDSFQYQGCQTSIFPSRACPDTSRLMSSARVKRRACRPVRAVCAAARRETRQPELPRDFCPTLPPWRAFCSPVWCGGVTALHKIRS